MLPRYAYAYPHSYIHTPLQRYTDALRSSKPNALMKGVRVAKLRVDGGDGTNVGGGGGMVSIALQVYDCVCDCDSYSSSSSVCKYSGQQQHSKY